METFDEIWDGDFFGRRQEANDVLGYLQSVALRPSIREDGHAHVLAIDTSYGEGKTFFLRRLARHMRAADHAVAFVDAWVDDLEDEPIVALASTLEKALDPWIDKPGVGAGLARFRKEAGKVVKIAGWGALRRVVALGITESAVNQVGALMTSGDDLQDDFRKDAAADVGKIISESVSPPAALIDGTMAQRIARFRDGQAAIEGMKHGLRDIVGALTEAGMRLPITIIVDELDRCRPTYAVKLLEEVKHLFDVSGVAFVLGLHGQQLAHSVTAAYGAGFDGPAYLRRFFNRRYALKPVGQGELVEKLLSTLMIPPERLQYPDTRSRESRGPASQQAASKMIAAMLAGLNVAPRDTFQVMEILETAVALTAPHPVLLPYLLPLIVGFSIGRDGDVPPFQEPSGWEFVTYQGSFSNQAVASSFGKYFSEADDAASLTDNELMRVINDESASPGVGAVGFISFNNVPPNSAARPRNYRQLLRTVARFKGGARRCE